MILPTNCCEHVEQVHPSGRGCYIFNKEKNTTKTWQWWKFCPWCGLKIEENYVPKKVQ